MAPKLPRGFVLKKKDADSTDPSVAKARSLGVKEASQKNPTHQETGKKDKRSLDIPLDTNPPKKQKNDGASSHVSNIFGPISAAYVGENDVHKWQSLTTRDQDVAMIHAAAQLLTQTIGRAQRCQEERLILEKERANSKRLAEMVVETDNKWKKALDEKTASYESMKEHMEEAMQHRDLLNTENDKLRKEKEEMQLRIDSLELEKTKDLSEKTKQDIRDAGFQAGFDFYCIGFLAQDPDYDWSKWGAETVEDMALMKLERAEDIKKRRIDLGIEDEGAPLVVPASQLEDEIIPTAPTVPVTQGNLTVVNAVEETPAADDQDAS